MVCKGQRFDHAWLHQALQSRPPALICLPVSAPIV